MKTWEGKRGASGQRTCLTWTGPAGPARPQPPGVRPCPRTPPPHDSPGVPGGQSPIESCRGKAPLLPALVLNPRIRQTPPRRPSCAREAAPRPRNEAQEAHCRPALFPMAAGQALPPGARGSPRGLLQHLPPGVRVGKDTRQRSYVPEQRGEPLTSRGRPSCRPGHADLPPCQATGPRPRAGPGCSAAGRGPLRFNQGF